MKRHFIDITEENQEIKNVELEIKLWQDALGNKDEESLPKLMRYLAAKFKNDDDTIKITSSAKMELLRKLHYERKSDSEINSKALDRLYDIKQEVIIIRIQTLVHEFITYFTSL